MVRDRTGHAEAHPNEMSRLTSLTIITGGLVDPYLWKLEVMGGGKVVWTTITGMF